MKRNGEQRVIVLAVALAMALVVGVWATDFYLEGRDIVEQRGGGNLLLGEDLLQGGQANQYPVPSTATTLAAYVTTAGDRPTWVVIRGVDAEYNEQVDSLYITATGISNRKTTTTTWLGVNSAEKRGAVNIREICIYGSALDTTGIQAIIPPFVGKTSQAFYTMPKGRDTMLPTSWRVSAVPVSLAGDSITIGVVGVLQKQPGQQWRQVDQVMFKTGASGVTIQLPYLYTPNQGWMDRWYGPAGTRYKVAASITGASIDMHSKLQFGIQ